MSLRATRCLLIALAVSAAANAQQPAEREPAPVPRQVLAARTAFLGNGGGQTYGADTYFELTTFDGGPNRAYDEFYAALKDWGHYELVGSTRDADILLVIRFTNPIVSQQNAGYVGDLPHELIRDPQLDLAINEPKSGVTLWSLTEHIDPSGGKAAANRHFDEAVARLVDDLKRLILHPEESVAPQTIALPPGAIAAAQRRQREMHAGIGMVLGGAAAAFIASRTDRGLCSDFNFARCSSGAQKHSELAFVGLIAGAAAGAVVGWLWPVRN
jgi:hypothetical protein